MKYLVLLVMVFSFGCSFDEGGIPEPVDASELPGANRVDKFLAGFSTSDASPDALLDAPIMEDASLDAAADAIPDASPDAMIDATPDAMVDASLPPDADLSGWHLYEDFDSVSEYEDRWLEIWLPGNFIQDPFLLVGGYLAINGQTIKGREQIHLGTTQQEYIQEIRFDWIATVIGQQSNYMQFCLYNPEEGDQSCIVLGCWSGQCPWWNGNIPYTGQIRLVQEGGYLLMYRNNVLHAFVESSVNATHFAIKMDVSSSAGDRIYGFIDNVETCAFWCN